MVHESIVASVRDAIEKANAGLMPPVWQKQIVREVQSHLSVPWKQDETKRLLEALQKAIQARPQISEYEYTCKELSERGLELLFYYADGENFMELIYVPGQNQYTCCVGVDPELSLRQQRERAKEMERVLTDWAKEHKIKVEPCNKRLAMGENVPLYHTTLHEALEFMLMQLRAD